MKKFIIIITLISSTLLGDTINRIIFTDEPI